MLLLRFLIQQFGTLNELSRAARVISQADREQELIHDLLEFDITQDLSCNGPKYAEQLFQGM